MSDDRRSSRPQGSGRDMGARRAPSGRPQGQPRREGGQRPAQRREYDDRSMRGDRVVDSRRTAPNGRRPQKQKSKTGKVVLIIFEILLLVALGIALYFILNTTKAGKIELPEEDIIINEEVKAKLQAQASASNKGSGDTANMTGYRNIALFGVDSREGALTKNTRSDTIMVASINMETGDCKLISVFRDTYLNLSNDSYNKCNAAYAKGGPMQAINMLNMNLDLDITDFVTIGFEGLIDVIDAVGGVEINVTEAEIKHLNNYQISMVGKSSDGINFTANEGTDYIPVKSPGMQTLNGLQATAYCRIRYVGDDFQRAERQRTVIKAIMDKAKANPGKLAGIAESVFDEVYTSLDLSEILDILSNITKYQIVDEMGFPDADMRAGGTIGNKGSCIVPLTLENNVILLHEFMFGEKNYEPSSTVKTCSQQIINETGQYLK